MIEFCFCWNFARSKWNQSW